MQFVADILPAIVERPASIETTAWGAAYVAGLARDLYPEPEVLVEGWRPEHCFAPRMSDNEREERHTGWRRAVAGVLATAS
jgi:glycerol kinase